MESPQTGRGEVLTWPASRSARTASGGHATGTTRARNTLGHFARKVDAQRWIDETTAAVVTGQYVDPKAGKTTVREYAKAWQAAQVTREHTRRNIDIALRLHVLPHIGGRTLGSIRPSDMQALVKTLSATLAPGTVGQVYKVAGRMFAAAVDDRILAASPCHRVRLPRDDRPEVVVPAVEQIMDLAGAVPSRYRALVVLLAGSGLRIGEALGLNVSDVDFLRRTVKVERQRLQSGRIGPPKTAKSARTVPLGQVVIDELAAHLAAYPSDGALFTLAGAGPLRLPDVAGRPGPSLRGGFAGRRHSRAAALLRERAHRGRGIGEGRAGATRARFSRRHAQHVRALVARR